MRFLRTGFFSMIVIAVVTACEGGAGGGGSSNGIMSGVGPAQRVARNYKTDALVFNGTGTAGVDTDSVEEILDDHGLTFRTVAESELNRMTVDDIADYGVIVWPGGRAGTMSGYLESEAKANVRKAVHEKGVSFVGFCAGAFIAGISKNDGDSWGLGILPIDFPYYHLEFEISPDVAQLPVALSNGTSRDLLWYGGPELANIPGVIGRYPDGTTAIGQAWAGNGLVILAGPHPEGPQGWRDMFGLEDSDGLDFELAFQMIESALKQQPMATF